MPAILSSLSESDWWEIVKWVFVVSYVLATIGVTIGVYLENERFPKKTQDKGWKILIWSLGADTLFTILIFSVDAKIGRIQRGEIIALEEALAPRTLSVKEMELLSSKASVFGKIPFVLATDTTHEGFSLAQQIGVALRSGGWDWPPGGGTIALNSSTGDPSMELAIDSGIKIEVPAEQREVWSPAASEIGEILARVSGVKVSALIMAPNQIPSNAVRIVVGAKQ